MELVNRKHLVLEQQTITSSTGVDFCARRKPNESDTVLICRSYDEKLRPAKIESLSPELKEQVLELEYFEGSTMDAIRQGLIEGLDPSKRYFLVSGECLEAVQETTISYLSDGLYSESELSKAFGQYWEAKCKSLGIVEL